MPTDTIEEFFPLKPSIPDAAVAQDFALLRQVGHSDPHLDFQVPYPKGWTASAGAGDLSRSGRFQGRILIQATRKDAGLLEIALATFPREVNTLDWLGIALGEAGERVITSRPIELPLQSIPDVLSETTAAAGRLLRRSMVTRDRDRMWLVSAQAAETEFRELAGSLLFSISNFQLLSPELAPYAEKLDEYSDRDPFPMSFRFPASWKSRKAPVHSKEAQRVLIETFDDNQRAGSVVLRTWMDAGPTDDEALSTYCEELETKGWAPARIGWRKTERTFGASAVLWADIRGTAGGKRVDLTAALLRGKRAVALISMAGPDRSISPSRWAVNKRAFEIVQESIRLA